MFDFCKSKLQHEAIYEELSHRSKMKADGIIATYEDIANQVNENLSPDAVALITDLLEDQLLIELDTLLRLQ